MPFAQVMAEKRSGGETLWPAPAKLNLFLHVTGRRADGYHTLQTAFQLLDLCDTVGIALRADGRIERTAGPEGVAPEDDLAVRAARALQAASGTRHGATLRIRKCIPMGGGLGGGSSDAATVLLALDRLWGTGLSRDELATLGLKLGADVPLFVHGASAWAEGIGERLTPLELPSAWFVIVHPGVVVPTREIFQAPELARDSLSITPAEWLRGAGRNDCEPVVRARFPAVGEALDWLRRFGPAQLTGTGACVFARCATRMDAERLAARVPDEWRSLVARGLARSPLEAELERPLG